MWGVVVVTVIQGISGTNPGAVSQVVFGELRFLSLIELGSSEQALRVLLCVKVTVIVFVFWLHFL